jgi:BirA family biotin operon repressor/biotin-[acetyl-CoA-carboxylase] ligase
LNPRDQGSPEGLRSDNCSPKGLRYRLARERLGRLGSVIHYFPTLGSTNDAASTFSARAVDDPEGLIVIADEQTAGRGRRGHTWFSPPRSGLYVSVVLTPARARAEPMRAASLLTIAAGVALAEAIETATGLRVDMKWPNDLCVGRRKLGGILAETAGDPLRHPTVLGYGINVRATAYPPEIALRATSLDGELRCAVDRDALLVETLTALARRYDDLLDARFDAILDAWRARAPAAHGARVSWTMLDGPQSGITSGIDADGALLVRVGDRTERIVSGELTWG